MNGQKSIRGKQNKNAKKRYYEMSILPRERGTILPPQPFTRQELQEINIQISASWFQSPKLTQVTLMAVNPWKLHAYWNIETQDMFNAGLRLPAGLDGAPLILRFTDLSPPEGADNEHRVDDHCFDIVVEHLRNNWYVDLWRDGCRYSAQLGFRTEDGEIIALAKSNEISMPTATPSLTLDYYQREACLPSAKNLDGPGLVSDNRTYLLRNYLLQQLLPKKNIFSTIALDRLHKIRHKTRPKTKQKILEQTESKKPFSSHDHGQVPSATALQASATTLQQGKNPLDGYYADFYTDRYPTNMVNTEFPQIEIPDVHPSRIFVEKEETRFLKATISELPPVTKQLVSPTNVVLIPQGPSFLEDTDVLHRHVLKQGVSPENNLQDPSIEIGSDSTGDDKGHLVPKWDEITRTHLSPPHLSPPHLSPPQKPWPENSILAGSLSDSLLDSLFKNTSDEQTNIVEESEPLPIVALEDVSSTSYFSFRGDDSSFEIELELMLCGKIKSDSALHFFGEAIDVDPNGNFSINLKVNRGPELSALLYGQRNRLENHH